MTATMKIIACICIFNTLFMGCYSSAMISPTGEDKDLIYTNKIETILTKDSTKVAFDSPPVVLSSAVVGDTGGVRVVIPFDNIKEVQLLKYGTGRAIGIGVAIGVTALIVVALISWHGSSKSFDESFDISLK
jgi:hypothetical protein